MAKSWARWVSPARTRTPTPRSRRPRQRPSTPHRRCLRVIDRRFALVALTVSRAGGSTASGNVTKPTAQCACFIGKIAQEEHTPGVVQRGGDLHELGVE